MGFWLRIIDGRVYHGQIEFRICKFFDHFETFLGITLDNEVYNLSPPFNSFMRIDSFHCFLDEKVQIINRDINP